MRTETIEQTLHHALEQHQAGQLEIAQTAYRKILARDPNHADALHLLGLVVGQRGQLDESISLIQRAIEIEPRQAAFYANLGESFRRAGKLDEAVAAFERAIALDAGDAVSLSNLGGALWSQGKLDEAIGACQRAIALQPQLADAHANLGNALRDKGQIERALDACARAVELNPNLAEAHHNLGNCLLAIGTIDEAIDAFLKAIALKPDHALAFNNLGNAYRAKRRLDDAIEAYGNALKLSPALAEAYYNLGIALKDKGQLDKAILAYTTAVHFKPGYAEAHNNLGNALRVKGDLDQAVVAFEKAIESQPGYIEAYNNLGAAYTDRGDLDFAIDCFRKAIALKPDSAIVHSNLVYTLHFHAGYGPQKLLQENQRWAEMHEKPLAGARFAHKKQREKSGRLRIGYVSPDFRIHAAACFLLPLLSHHDANNVEVVVYSGVKRPDAMTERLKTFAPHWRDTTSWSDGQLAHVIHDDGIDILVDLTLHMAANRLLAFAQKPAPVQITWLGYPGTTGMSSIDYRLTDPYLDPPGEGDAFYSEKSIRLPRTFWCYAPLIETPAVNELPALASGRITFGCLNNFAKVTPATIALWIEVMRAVPDSRLIVQSYAGSHLDRVRERFELGGISRERLEFVGKEQPLDYFRLYHRIDIVLDPIPYPGHTSSLDALWMGAPVITLAGATAASRGGASILSNVGLRELIGRSPAEYIDNARKLANDLQYLADIRRTLPDRMLASPLTDAAQFAKDLEKTYRALWSRYLLLDENAPSPLPSP
jgi:protein O-GlcNAc transferase